MTRIESLRKQLREIGKFEEDYPGGRDEIRRHMIEQLAVEVADEIILEGSNGDTEETDYLTSRVALKFAEKVEGRLASELLKKDLEKRHELERSKTFFGNKGR